jgi:hypothetical protein
VATNQANDDTEEGVSLMASASAAAVTRSRTARTAFVATCRTSETSCDDVVELRVDGVRCFASFALDASEDRRRRAMAVGPTTDRRLLHALWDLPEDVPVPWGSLDALDAATLREVGRGFVQDLGGAVLRLYRPAGRVTAVAAIAGRLDEAVRRVGQYPPIFRRLAVCVGVNDVRDEDVDLAVRYGIGGVVLQESQARVVVDPAPPQLGVPSVYRWWIGELAYRNRSYTPTASAHSRS